MAMAQGFTREQVESILEDIDGTTLIDEKTKRLLHFAALINGSAHKVHAGTIQKLHDQGCTDEEVFEAVAVTALFNYMDRMADALGAPMEGFQEMVEQMMNA
jgi:alkylhydroperoxidase/carboxymuconolactone decarboxylase family protein YurZ